MDRRQFLLAVPCGTLLPSLASAQEPGRLYRIAFITPSEALIEMMRKFQLPELARFGFVEGRNLTVTTHAGPPARMSELAREAVATKPDVVIAVSTVAILAVKEASSTVPIVMSFIGEDPIEKGVAKSFARPGGSVTGVAMLAAEMDGKRASLLHDFVPAARRIAILTGRGDDDIGLGGDRLAGQLRHARQRAHMRRRSRTGQARAAGISDTFRPSSRRA